VVVWWLNDVDEHVECAKCAKKGTQINTGTEGAVKALSDPTQLQQDFSLRKRVYTVVPYM